jgi:hypothetical protein
MTKAKKPERRDRQFNIGLTAYEYALLLRRAAALGMRPVDYGRAKLFAIHRIPNAPERSTPHLDPLFHAQLSRIGNNLNQIARGLHQFDMPPPASLEPVLREITDLIKRGHEQ